MSKTMFGIKVEFKKTSSRLSFLWWQVKIKNYLCFALFVYKLIAFLNLILIKHSLESSLEEIASIAGHSMKYG